MLECQNRTARFEKCKKLLQYQNHHLLRHLVVDIILHVSLLFNTWVQGYKTFISIIYKFCNELECLSLASLSSLVKCLLVSPEPTRVKPLSDDTL
jgi:hypothetical protein